MSPKNASKEKTSIKQKAKSGGLVGLVAVAVILGAKANGDGNEGGSSADKPESHGGSIFCSDPKVVETVNVTASQIIKADTKAEIATLGGIHKVNDVNRINFTYNHDVVKNPQEAGDFRDAASEYFDHIVVSVTQHAGITAAGQVLVYKCE
jgi:hypothetical protein